MRIPSSILHTLICGFVLLGSAPVAFSDDVTCLSSDLKVTFDPSRPHVFLGSLATRTLIARDDVRDLPHALCFKFIQINTTCPGGLYASPQPGHPKICLKLKPESTDSQGVMIRFHPFQSPITIFVEPIPGG